VEPASSFTILLMGATPFVEARYTVLYAVLQGYAPLDAYILAVVGTLLPVIPLLLLLDPVSRWLSEHSDTFHRFFTWLFERTRVHSPRFERWGTLALFLFVAVPLPTTGAWSGCAAAFVFGIRFAPAFTAIAAGTLVAALITMLPFLGFTSILGA
jgi:uncharacterized membrane protein